MRPRQVVRRAKHDPLIEREDGTSLKQCNQPNNVSRVALNPFVPQDHKRQEESTESTKDLESFHENHKGVVSLVRSHLLAADLLHKAGIFIITNHT